MLVGLLWLPSGAEPARLRACDRLGNTVELRQFEGEPVLLAFMAFWCDTWKPLLVDLKKLKFTGQIVLIAVDSRERQGVEEQMIQAELPFQLWIDLDQQLVRHYQVSTVPTLILLDRKQSVVQRHQGFPGQRVLQSELADLENDQVPSDSIERQNRLLASALIPEERGLLKAINQERAQRHLKPLGLSTPLIDVARERIQRNLERGQMTHDNPTSPVQALKSRGVEYRKLAENLAEAQSAKAAVAAMLKSPTHKANLLNPAYRSVGVAALRCGPQGFLYGVLFTDP